MGLVVKFGTSAGGDTQAFSGNPPWLGDLNNSWSFSSDSINYGHSTVDKTVYVQYGQKTPTWASNRFWAQSLVIKEMKKNDDGSITSTVSVTAHFWKSIRITSNAGYPVTYSITIDGKQIWSYSGSTIDSINMGSVPPIDITTTLKPGEHTNRTAFHISVNYPGGHYAPNSFYIGLYLHNEDGAGDEPPEKITEWKNKGKDLLPPVKDSEWHPYKDLEPKYKYIGETISGDTKTHNYLLWIKPWAIRKSSVFKSLDRPSGFFMRRSNNTWVDTSRHLETEVGVPNAGVARIRKGGVFLGQNKIGED